jgi:hypothetical protein
MSAENIYVNEPLSSRKIMEILDKNPDLKKISCPPSLYRRISPKYLDALENLGIEVEAVRKKVRSRKYTENDHYLVKKLLKEGKTPKQISGQTNIPLKTVYYLNKDFKLKKGPSSKYGASTRLEINKMIKNGFSAKQISEKLNIPLRSVYYLLKAHPKR